MVPTPSNRARRPDDGAERLGDGVVQVATLVDVADALTADDIGVLAVAKDGDVIGIASERDLAHAVALRRDSMRPVPRRSPTRRLSPATPSPRLPRWPTEIMEHWVRHVVVEEAGRVVGIVSARDLRAAYASADMPID